jgi:hypothetical protein
MQLAFYKTNNKWYIHYPEWKGDISELEMVSGADILLDIVSGNLEYVGLYVSLTSFDNCEYITKKELSEFGGAIYHISSYIGIPYDFDLWLCSVTEHVLGELPEIIYFKKN